MRVSVCPWVDKSQKSALETLKRAVNAVRDFFFLFFFPSIFLPHYYPLIVSRVLLLDGLFLLNVPYSLRYETFPFCSKIIFPFGSYGAMILSKYEYMHAEITEFKGNHRSSHDYKKQMEKYFYILQKEKFRNFLQGLRIFQQTKCG